MELKKGQTIMVDANLQQPSSALHEDVSKRSGLPADTFELYHGSKRLEGEAVLGSWGVEKGSLIEVKTRGRGGMRGGGGGEGGVDSGGGVGGGGGGTGSSLGGVGGVGGGGSGCGSGVGGGGIGGIDSGSGAGGADSDLGVAGGGVAGGGDAEGRNAGQERTRNQDGKRPHQDSKGKPPSWSKVHAEKQWLQNAKSAAQLEPETDRNALGDIVPVTASTGSGIEVHAEVRADSTVGGEPTSIEALQISSAQATSHGPPAPTPSSANYQPFHTYKRCACTCACAQPSFKKPSYIHPTLVQAQYR